MHIELVQIDTKYSLQRYISRKLTKLLYLDSRLFIILISSRNRWDKSRKVLYNSYNILLKIVYNKWSLSIAIGFAQTSPFLYNQVSKDGPALRTAISLPNLLEPLTWSAVADVRCETKRFVESAVSPHELWFQGALNRRWLAN